MVAIVPAAEHECLLGVAQSCRRLDQRVQDRLEVDGRAADDLEHVAGRGELIN